MSSAQVTASISAEVARRYPKPSAVLAYGTAGFRARAEILDSTFFRMGMLAVLRSRARGGLAVGLMVTASHNAEPDNGIKLVDADGGMLAQSWEAHATAVANAPAESLGAELARVAEAEAIGASEHEGLVLLGRDTRPHSERLCAIALEGAGLLGGGVDDCGLLTTPQLHHLVRTRNGAARGDELVGPAEWASEAGYYAMLSDAYAQLTAGVAPPAPRGPLWVDGAFGVGAPKISALAPAVRAAGLELRVANAVGEGELNKGCGAEHVQKGRVPPVGFEAPLADCRRACSVDGDADRVVFHYHDAAGAWRLLDGDKIAALCASFVCAELQALHLAPPLSVAVVQTAYANGAAAAYLKGLGLEVALAKTGVKFLHHEALRYDVAIYFEANGHGTLLFSDQAARALLAARAAAADKGDAPKRQAAARLLAARQLINQAVGDAISDLLFVEAVLHLRGWRLEDWDALYADLPSRQSKLPVRDRSAITTTADETRCTAPAPLQPALDALMARYEHGRCFVRPSGTEDVVRVYAEAATQEAADELALLAAQAAWTHAGGMGEMPSQAVA